MFFGKSKRNRTRDTLPRGGIDSFPADRDAMDEGPPGPDLDPEMPCAGAEAAPDVPEGSFLDEDLARRSTESRYDAERRMRADDQKRQTMFACACVVAGFCGIAGVIFGTAAVCSRIGQPQPLAVAAPPSVVAGQGSQEVWYDAAGQMHINVHITREPDKEVNIYIDQDGNVSTEKPLEGADAQTPDPSGADGTENGEPGDSCQEDVQTDPDEGDSSQDGSGQSTTESGEPPRSEEELLAEMQARKDAGGSGYAETDEQYVVKQGDTLSKISGRTGFSVDFLAAYNGLRDRNMIITGEILRYPSFTGEG